MTNSWPKAILLDFYGTVVEEIFLPVKDICNRISAVAPSGVTEAEVVAYWVKSFSSLCTQSFGTEFQHQKDLEAQSLQDALGYFKIPLDARILNHALSDYRAHPDLYPESKRVISRCHVPTCLVTNIDNAEIQSAVRHCGLYFDYIVTSEDCRAYKPRREVFERALTVLGRQPSEVLHVGDNWQGDVQGAKSLGIPVLWIDRRKRPVPEAAFHPDYTSEDLNGLLQFLGSL